MVDFLSKSNINLIWELLIDEDILKNKSRDIIENINKTFNQSIIPFYESEKQKHKTTSLVELNKKFISIILNYVNKNFPSRMNNVQQPKKKDVITFEELQSERQNEFEKQLAKRQQEFTNAMTLQIPEKPNFNDTLDSPINEIEVEVKKIMTQRNYDIEQINKSFNTEQADNWLKPQNSSIRNEKAIQQKTVLNTNTTNTTNGIKYIKIDNNELKSTIYQNDVIDLNSPIKKHISWEDEDKAKESTTGLNIFKKFKLLPSMLTEESDNISLTIKEEDTNEINDTKTQILHMEENIKNLNNKMENMNTTLMEILKVLQKNKND